MKNAPFFADALTSAFGTRKPDRDPPDSRAFQPSMWPDFLASEPGRPVRVILIDDDPHIRRVIAGELVSDMRIDMVGQADGLREGRRLVSMCEFDVMIVDLNLGDGSGFDLIEHMKQVRPQAEAIVVSIMDDEVRAMRAFELGATGYLVKNSWFGSFTQAVLQVFNGGASITPSLARRLLQKLEQPMSHLPTSERDGSGRQALSEREREVLRLVSVGHTSNEIATKLTLSVQTVNTHIRNIYRKLHVKSRAQAVNLAAHQRLI
ncbi:MAG: DNA-binding response regulator [Betaproteobacteria bacterium HGW-Betaproteobacteria-9]|jgi:DNA-binding NarL/FixJ family response regulator|nr:MAG: DNA-binding response regulator [Betaproteobacteria bacterium HGW-Betaproteobacteria-9]